MSIAVAPRHTAEERREEILQAAVVRFGETGLHGTSTEAIARDVGVSQPYLFRLYGTKKQLYLAAVEWGFAETLAVFETAIAEAVSPHDAFRRIGNAYFDLVSDRRYLGIQMQSYASTDDPDIREAVQLGFGRLVTRVQEATQATPQQIAVFFGRGMLMNVAMSMGVIDQEEGWPALVREGCLGGFEEL